MSNPREVYIAGQCIGTTADLGLEPDGTIPRKAIGNVPSTAPAPGVVSQEGKTPKQRPGARSKYGAVKTEYKGRVYDSRKEADYACELDLRLVAGEITGWIPQVRIPLLVGYHQVDFLVLYPTRVEFVEVKGRDLAMGRRKRWEVRKMYGIEIKVV